MWNSRTNLSFHISTPMSVAEGMKDVLGSVIGPLVYEELFLSLRDDMGKKGKGAESGRRTQEHRRTRARARVRETRNNVVDTLASFSGVAPRHRIGESESRMLGWAQRARRGRNNATRYHVFSFF